MEQQAQQYADEDYSSSSGNSGTYATGEQEFLKDIIDVNKTLDTFEHRVLRGEYFFIDEHSGKAEWKPIPNTQRLMNETGVKEIMARMVGKISTAAKLTFKDDEEIYKDMFFFDMSISEAFAKRAPNWEMDIEVMKSIKDAVVDAVWDCVSSCRNGFTFVQIKSTYTKQDITRQDTSTQGKSGGFLSNLIGGKK